MILSYMDVAILTFFSNNGLRAVSIYMCEGDNYSILYYFWHVSDNVPLFFVNFYVSRYATTCAYKIGRRKDIDANV